MKLTALFYIVIFLLPFLNFAQVLGDSFKSASEDGSATLALVHNNTAGFAERKEDGNVTGILCDLMGEFKVYVKKAYNIDVSFRYVEVEKANFSQFLTTVERADGGVFGLSNASITEERKSRFLFSPPFIQNITVMVSNENVPNLSGMNSIGTEFSNLTALSVTSSTYLAKLEEIKKDYYPSLQIELFESGQRVMEELGRNDKAFAIVDLLYYLDFLQQGYNIKRHRVGDEAGDEFAIIMPKSNDWSPILSEFLNGGFMSSSEYRRIVSDHLGKSATRLIE